MASEIVRFFFYLFLLLVALFGLAFAGLNATPVTVHYLAGQAELSLSMLLIGTLCVGASLGVVATLALLCKLKHENSRLRGQMLKKEKEVNHLRMLPMKELD